MSDADVIAKRPRTPGLPMDLASLFYNVEFKPELPLFYAGIKRAGLELNSDDHARMVAAREALERGIGLPSLEDVKAIPIRRKTPLEIVAEVTAANANMPPAAPAPAASAPPVSPRPVVAKQPSPQATAAIAEYRQKVQNHLQAVNAARTMSRRGLPPLTAADLPQSTLDTLKMEAADVHFVKTQPGGVNAEAVAAAKAFAAAKFGR